MPQTPRARRALFLLSAFLALPGTGCAVAGPIPMAIGQAETIVCEGSSRYTDAGLTCEGELRWVTGGPISSGLAGAIGGVRDTALRAAGAAVGVPVAP